ncbi:HU family DNA-binding protein [Halomonas cupida]|nr:HU family DNA-binding protein [Halomonas cupida]
MTRFTEPVAKGLSQGDRLILPNFGTVETCQRAARTGSNLQTGAV